MLTVKAYWLSCEIDRKGILFDMDYYPFGLKVLLRIVMLKVWTIFTCILPLWRPLEWNFSRGSNPAERIEECKDPFILTTLFG